MKTFILLIVAVSLLCTTTSQPTDADSSLANVILANAPVNNIEFVDSTIDAEIDHRSGRKKVTQNMSEDLRKELDMLLGGGDDHQDEGSSDGSSDASSSDSDSSSSDSDSSSSDSDSSSSDSDSSSSDSDTSSSDSDSSSSDSDSSSSDSDSSSSSDESGSDSDSHKETICKPDEVLWGSKCIPAENGRKESSDTGIDKEAHRSLDKEVAAFLKDTADESESSSSGQSEGSDDQSDSSTDGRSVSIKLTINRKGGLRSERLEAARSFCKSPRAKGKKIRICFVIDALDQAGLSKIPNSKNKKVAVIQNIDLQDVVTQI
jgi:hypothetical protein